MNDILHAKIKSLEEENKKLSEMVEKLTESFKKESIRNYFSSELYDETPVGILLFNNDLEIKSVNATFCNIFNLGKPELVGFDLKRIKDTRIIPAYNNALKGFEGFYEGLYHPTLSQESKYISIHTKPLFDKITREVNGGIAVYTDITENRLAENAVNKSYDTFQTVTDNINAIVIVIDSNNDEILFMNSKAIEVYGNEVGSHCKDVVISKNLRDKNQKRCVKSITELQFIGEFYNADNQQWYKPAFGNVKWIDGRNALIMTSINITELIVAEERIKNQNKELEGALEIVSLQNEKINKQSDFIRKDSETKNRMFSIIGHDLRGPFGNIKNAIDVVLDDFEEFSKEDIKNFLQPVQYSAGMAYQLLANLLYWAKSQNNNIKTSPEKIIISDAIEESLTLLKSNFENKKISVEYNSVDVFEITADENLINTIFRNLISNAIKFSHESGKIEINTEKVISENKQFVKVTIIDHGVGISEENIKRIKEKKWDFSTYGTLKEKGSGLGLSLCFEFVEMLGGKIEIISRQNEGSVFSVFFPM